MPQMRAPNAGSMPVDIVTSARYNESNKRESSSGALTFGLSRAQMPGIFARWPNAGFLMRLAQLTWQRLRSHPLSPLPVPRWQEVVPGC